MHTNPLLMPCVTVVSYFVMRLRDSPNLYQSHFSGLTRSVHF